LPPVNTTANQYFNQNAAILGWGLLNPGKYFKKQIFTAYRNAAAILSVKEELVSTCRQTCLMDFLTAKPL
jgi:hypothetical protein